MNKLISTPTAIVIVLIVFVVSIGLILLGYLYIVPKYEFISEQNKETVQIEGTEEIDTSDWNTYTNKEYGFELDYPQSIIYKEYPFIETRPNLVVLFTDNPEKISFGDLSLSIMVENKPAESLESYINKIVKQKNEEGEDAAASYRAVIEKIQIGGQEGFEIKDNDASIYVWTSKTIYLEKYNYLYVIYYSYSATMVAQELTKGMSAEEIARWKEQGLKYDNIQKILSTFKFIDNPEEPQENTNNLDQGDDEKSSQVLLYQVIDTPEDRFTISFDYIFKTETGVLDLTLDSVVLAIINAEDKNVNEEYSFETLINDPDLFGLKDVLLEFRFFGKKGSEVLIGNIQLKD